MTAVLQTVEDCGTCDGCLASLARCADCGDIPGGPHAGCEDATRWEPAETGWVETHRETRMQPAEHEMVCENCCGERDEAERD